MNSYIYSLIKLSMMSLKSLTKILFAKIDGTLIFKTLFLIPITSVGKIHVS